MSIIVVLVSACTTEPQVKSTDINQIKLEIIDKSNRPDGYTYTILLKNLSQFTIAQNNVFISYPIKTNSGTKGNEFKIEAKNNKLHIKPKEEITLIVFAPFEAFEGNQNLEIENFNIEIVGYIEDVIESRRFHKFGGIGLFK